MELVDLAVRRVNFVLSLPDGQVRFFVHPGATMDAKSLGTLNRIRLQLTPSPPPLPPTHTYHPRPQAMLHIALCSKTGEP